MTNGRRAREPGKLLQGHSWVPSSTLSTGAALIVCASPRAVLRMKDRRHATRENGAQEGVK